VSAHNVQPAGTGSFPPPVLQACETDDRACADSPTFSRGLAAAERNKESISPAVTNFRQNVSGARDNLGHQRADEMPAQTVAHRQQAFLNQSVAIETFEPATIPAHWRRTRLVEFESHCFA